jgi:hypothetical protein
MIHQLALVYAQAGLPDPSGNLWSWFRDQAKSLWYIGVVGAAVLFLFARRREGFGHAMMMAVGFGVLVFSAPGLGRFVTKLGNALFA